MDWKDEEKAELISMHERGCGPLQVATRAVELAGARGGTMTAERFDEVRRRFRGHEVIEELLAHISTLGARNAVLEEELENTRPFESLHADLSAQLREAWEATGVAGTVKGMTTLADVVGVTKADLREALAEVEKLRERLSAAEDGNRELVRRAQQAESLLERERKHHAETREMHSQMCRVSVEHQRRAEAAEARCATLSAAGQVAADTRKECTCLDTCRGAAGLGEGWKCAMEYRRAAPARYPCSPACTHDDAATPGHPERVKERSEAVKEAATAAVEMVRRDNELTRAYDNGAEAMRAACWDAVRGQIQAFAMAGGLFEAAVKKAIEGAAP